MRIFLVGANGTIGRAVARELGRRHDLVTGGRRSGEIRIDLANPESIAAAYEELGSVDAVVCAAGNVHFAPLAEMAGADYELGLRDKLMGQVHLVLLGRDRVREGGSFTLTTGVLSRDPVIAGSSASMVNGAVDAWVRAAAIELPRRLRVNAVSPGVIEEALDMYGPFFRGFEPVPAARAARAYAKSVEGAQTGQVYPVD